MDLDLKQRAADGAKRASHKAKGLLACVVSPDGATGLLARLGAKLTGSPYGAVPIHPAARAGSPPPDATSSSSEGVDTADDVTDMEVDDVTDGDSDNSSTQLRSGGPKGAGHLASDSESDADCTPAPSPSLSLADNAHSHDVTDTTSAGSVQAPEHARVPTAGEGGVRRPAHLEMQPAAEGSM